MLKLVQALKPIEPFREDIVFLRGLYNQAAVAHRSAHLGRVPNLLSGGWVSTDQNDIRCGKTMDQLMAQQIGDHTPVPSLVLGIEPTELRLEDGLSMLYGSCISWTSETKPAMKEIYPARVFDLLVGTGTGRRLDRSILDHVMDDAKDLKRRIGLTDQRKLDDYLESIRDVEKRIERASGNGRLEGWRPSLTTPDMSRPAEQLPQDVPEHMKLMLDLIVLAFQTDTTRVAAYQMCAEDGVGVCDRFPVLAGVCKGAGMISPHMATMLCFLLSDANIDRPALNEALTRAVRSSFNRITVDGDMSTNDTVLAIANGLAGNDIIKKGSPDFERFSEALTSVAYGLAAMIVRDGEGATKLVEVEVRNAKSRQDADKAAFAIANSLLVKTAIYGNDSNWGRIMAALGYSGAAIREERTDIYIGKVKVVGKGLSNRKDGEANEVLKANREVRIVVDLHLGDSSAKVLTCDLTEEYVKVNAEYRT